MAGKTTAAALSASKRAAADLAGAIEETRVEIIRLTEQRYDADRSPVSQAEAVDRVQSWTDGLRAQSLARITPDRFTSRAFHEPRSGDVLELILGVMADDIRLHIETKLAAAYLGKPGLSALERAAEIASIDARLFALELAEESMIRSAELSGFDILRRSDADPRAVLAHDEVMP